MAGTARSSMGCGTPASRAFMSDTSGSTSDTRRLLPGPAARLDGPLPRGPVARRHEHPSATGALVGLDVELPGGPAGPLAGERGDVDPVAVRHPPEGGVPDADDQLAQARRQEQQQDENAE